MKTTIEIADETIRKAKVYAANNHTTMRQLFTEALEKFLEEADREKGTTRQERLKILLREMQASNTEGVEPLSRDEIYDR